jgi:hypothetical protein
MKDPQSKIWGFMLNDEELIRANRLIFGVIFLKTGLKSCLIMFILSMLPLTSCVLRTDRIDLIEERLPEAIPSSEAWGYQKSIEADLDGDGENEQILLLANVSADEAEMRLIL